MLQGSKHGREPLHLLNALALFYPVNLAQFLTGDDLPIFLNKFHAPRQHAVPLVHVAGGGSTTRSSSKVQFAFALFRSIDVDTRLSSWSGRHGQRERYGSRVGKSSQYAGWVSVIFQLG